MTQDRRQALIGRYRAGSQDRIRRVGLTLIELEQGRGSHAAVEEIARELHTLKGESRMLGFLRVSEVAHAAEDLLLATAKDGLPPGDMCGRVLAALDVVTRFLRQELTGLDADGALDQQRDELRQAALTAGHGQAPAPAASTAARAQEEALAAKEAAAREAEAQAPVRPVPAAAASAPITVIETDAGVAARPAVSADRWVQVNVARIDELCERMAEFESDFRALRSRLGVMFADAPRGATSAQRSLIEDFDRCRGLLEDVSGSAWALRLVPVEPALQELVHHARELSRQLGKTVRVVVRGAGAQVERAVLDELWEPLLHLVRNAIDHGVERPAERGDKTPEGLLTLTAEPVGSTVVLTVADDGRGIDSHRVREAAVKKGLLGPGVAEAMTEREVLELLFLHGFSTRTQVSEVSGRGVGLDVVRGKVEALGGAVAVSSEPGRGARFTLSLPTTISKERALVVDCGGSLYAVPSRHVVEVVRAADHAVENVAGGRAIRYRDAAIPVRSASQMLSTIASDEEPLAIVVESAGRRYAFTVPALIGEFDLLRRPVDALLAPFEHISASATLDDGRLVLVVLLSGLVRRSEHGVAGGAAHRPARRRRVLVVDDSPVIRELISEMLAGAGVEVELAPEGGTALSIIDAAQPDLVLSDVEMPGMDGFELLRRIRARWQHLPVVMLTTRNSAADKQTAATLGADAYLVKSDFQETTLLDTVRRFVGAGA